MHGAHGIFFATRFFSPTDYTDHSDFNSSFFRLLALLVILFSLGITQINLVSALAYYKIRSLTSSKIALRICTDLTPYGVWNYSTALFQLVYSISTLWFYLSWSTARFFCFKKKSRGSGDASP